MMGLASAALLLILWAGWRMAAVFVAPAAPDNIDILRVALNFGVAAIVCIGLLRRSRAAWVPR